MSTNGDAELSEGCSISPSPPPPKGSSTRQICRDDSPQSQDDLSTPSFIIALRGGFGGQIVAHALQATVCGVAICPILTASAGSRAQMPSKHGAKPRVRKKRGLFGKGGLFRNVHVLSGDL